MYAQIVSKHTLTCSNHTFYEFISPLFTPEGGHHVYFSYLCLDLQQTDQHILGFQ